MITAVKTKLKWFANDDGSRIRGCIRGVYLRNKTAVTAFRSGKTWSFYLLSTLVKVLVLGDDDGDGSTEAKLVAQAIWTTHVHGELT